jgi:hypothetical protein
MWDAVTPELGRQELARHRQGKRETSLAGPAPIYVKLSSL